MPNDYFPRTEGEKTAFLNNFIAVLSPIAASLGMTPGDMLAITGASADFQTTAADKLTKKGAAQAATLLCSNTAKSMEDTIRGMVRRIKSNPNYTAVIGEQLRIEADESEPTGGPEGERPNLEATSVLNGEVTISFIKAGHTGVEIRTKRGAEIEYSFLAVDSEAPYVDTRANLAAGPETRYYVARFLRRDTLVGELSDVLVVTVPGVA